MLIRERLCKDNCAAGALMVCLCQSSINIHRSPVAHPHTCMLVGWDCQDVEAGKHLSSKSNAPPSRSLRPRRFQPTQQHPSTQVSKTSFGPKSSRRKATIPFSCKGSQRRKPTRQPRSISSRCESVVMHDSFLFSFFHHPCFLEEERLPPFKISCLLDQRSIYVQDTRGTGNWVISPRRSFEMTNAGRFGR